MNEIMRLCEYYISKLRVVHPWIIAVTTNGIWTCFAGHPPQNIPLLRNFLPRHFFRSLKTCFPLPVNDFEKQTCRSCMQVSSWAWLVQSVIAARSNSFISNKWWHKLKIPRLLVHKESRQAKRNQMKNSEWFKIIMVYISETALLCNVYNVS